MATVTSNDRVFSCTIDSCDGGSAFRRFSSGGRQGGSITIRACFLDVDRIRESLYYALNHVGNELIQLRAWLYEREQEYELKFLANGGAASTDQATFNKVNVTLSRLRRQIDQLGRWYADFQDHVAYALDTLGSYNETASVLRNFAPSESTGGLPPNPIVLARRNITRAKAIQRQTNNLARTESRLNSTMARIQRQLDSFSNGIVRFRGRVINIPELATLIGQLSNDGSPLERVQLMIANASNSLKQVYSVGTETESKSVRVPETSQFRQLLPDADASMEELLEYLRTLSVSSLYTDNTKGSLEGAITYVRDRALKDRVPVRDLNGIPTGATQPNPTVMSAVERYASRIRASLPGRVIERYRAAMRDREGIYLRLNRLHELIGNVQPGDEIYKRELQDIYDETYDVLETELSASTDFDSNVNTGGGDGGSAAGPRRRGNNNDDPDDDSDGGTATGRRATKRKRRTLVATKRSSRSATKPTDPTTASVTVSQTQTQSTIPSQTTASSSRPQITSYVTIQPPSRITVPLGPAATNQTVISTQTADVPALQAGTSQTQLQTAGTQQFQPSTVTSTAYQPSNTVTYQPTTTVSYLPTNAVTYQPAGTGYQQVVSYQPAANVTVPTLNVVPAENRIATPPKGPSAFASFSVQPSEQASATTASVSTETNVVATDGTIFAAQTGGGASGV